MLCKYSYYLINKIFPLNATYYIQNEIVLQNIIIFLVLCPDCKKKTLQTEFNCSWIIPLYI